MIATARALSQWLQQFGLPVYTVDDVPDDAVVPYITIPLNEPEWDQKASFYIQPWYRSVSNLDLMQKADEITAAIGRGVVIPCAGGHIAIWPENPLQQLMVDGDFRSIYINLSINAYHMPGI